MDGLCEFPTALMMIHWKRLFFTWCFTSNVSAEIIDATTNTNPSMPKLFRQPRLPNRGSQNDPLHQ